MMKMKLKRPWICLFALCVVVSLAEGQVGPPGTECPGGASCSNPQGVPQNCSLCCDGNNTACLGCCTANFTGIISKQQCDANCNADNPNVACSRT